MRQTQNYNSKNQASRKNNNRYRSPYKTYLAIAVVLTLILVVGLIVLKFPIYLAYLLGINIVTFVFYAFDKIQAKRAKGRIPELVLHLLAVLGGAVGGLAGQWLLHHKTRKPIFHIVLWASLLVHLIIFVIFSHTLLTATFADLLTAGKSLLDTLNKPLNSSKSR